MPDAVLNVKELVEEMKDIPKDDIKRRELSYKASTDVLKATNVFPSPQYAQNIYNVKEIVFLRVGSVLLLTNTF